MRKVVLGAGISLDGYIARPDGAIDFLFIPKDYSMAPFFASIDVAIMGRKTLDAGLKMGGSFTSGESLKYYVFSKTLAAGQRDGLAYTRQSPASLIKQIRKSEGKNIWLMGGGELARAFLKADLVDELNLGVVPTLLGDGIPLFPGGFPQREFSLLENKTYGKGLISLRYKRERGPGKT